MERELSVLFADVAGSAKLYAKLGDAEAAYAVERCVKRMERSVEGFRGRVVKLAGGELMAVFAGPEDAVHAAGDMLQRIDDLPPVSGVKLAVRLGFHHGPAAEEGGELTGDAVGLAARLAGLARAGQALTGGDTVARLPELLQLSMRALEPGSDREKVVGVRLFEVLWQDGRVSARPPSPAALRLRLHYAGRSFVLDERLCRLSFGRDAACDVLVRDRRASRQHARLERRDGGWMLADLSTNGTYVTVDGAAEVLLHRGEMALRGAGRIAFAAPADSAGADVAEFELIP